MSTTTASGGSKPSRSSSAIVADTASGYHILRIDGYSGTKGTPTGEFHKSRAFTIGGYRWFIRYYPNGITELSKDYISFFLVLDQSVTKEVTVQYRIRFSDQAEQTPLASEEVTTFQSYSTSWRYSMFSKREDLEKSEHLKDDSFTIRCDIVIINNVYAKEIAEEATTPAFVSVPPSDLSVHFGDLLLTESGADVLFEIGSQTFAAHQCVLEARSPVFRDELFGTMEFVTTGVVRIDDIEAQVFKALLYFMYTDSLPKAKKEEDNVMCQHLLVAADKYNLKRLKLICEDKLCKYIDVGTVATILALAEHHHCNGLKKACFDFLSSPTILKAAVDTDGFKHLSRSCPAIMEELIVMLSNLAQ
ncbi:unnamed protein product [Urochloa decumbens]|uniref:Uncharacterized protein n=1 Tax=Urochloa decumbens TaxID=240449 RepID=A0ABC8WZ08_9POAL